VPDGALTGIGDRYLLLIRRETGNSLRSGSDNIYTRALASCKRAFVRKSRRPRRRYNMLPAEPGYRYNNTYIPRFIGRRRAASSEISASHGRCAVACEATEIASAAHILGARVYVYLYHTRYHCIVLYMYFIDEGRWKGATVVPPTPERTLYIQTQTRIMYYYIYCIYIRRDAFKHERLTVCRHPRGKDRAPSDVSR